MLANVVPFLLNLSILGIVLSFVGSLFLKKHVHIIRRVLVFFVGILIGSAGLHYRYILMWIGVGVVMLIGFVLVLGALNVYKKASIDLGLEVPVGSKPEKEKPTS